MFDDYNKESITMLRAQLQSFRFHYFSLILIFVFGCMVRSVLRAFVVSSTILSWLRSCLKSSSPRAHSTAVTKE